MATPLPMLYQSGYLTIKGYDALNDSYVLGIPNREVSQGLSECLVARAAPAALDDQRGDASAESGFWIGEKPHGPLACWGISGTFGVRGGETPGRRLTA